MGDQQAAQVVRGQIDRIYGTEPAAQGPPTEQQVPEPYARTHKQEFDWRQYHSAWQQ